MNTLADDVLSLWPHSWEQRHNRFRILTLERQLDALTGDDWQRYNAIADAVESGDFSEFCRLVRGPSGVGGTQ